MGPGLDHYFSFAKSVLIIITLIPETIDSFQRLSFDFIKYSGTVIAGVPVVPTAELAVAELAVAEVPTPSAPATAPATAEVPAAARAAAEDGIVVST